MSDPSNPEQLPEKQEVQLDLDDLDKASGGAFRPASLPTSTDATSTPSSNPAGGVFQVIPL